MMPGVLGLRMPRFLPTTIAAIAANPSRITVEGNRATLGICYPEQRRHRQESHHGRPIARRIERSRRLFWNEELLVKQFGPASLLEGDGFELVWGFSCQAVVWVVLTVFVRSGKGRFSSRRLGSGSRSARKGSRDRNASKRNYRDAWDLHDDKLAGKHVA